MFYIFHLVQNSWHSLRQQKMENTSYPTDPSTPTLITVKLLEETSFVTVIDVYLPPVLIVIGFICNILVLKIMRSVYFRFVSTSVFIFLTSCLDIFSLLVLLSVHWVNANFPSAIYRGDHAHIMCKIFNFFGWGTSDLGILFTTGMSAERSLAILFPMKTHNLCTRKKAKQICAVSAFFVVVKDFHFTFTSDITPPTRLDLLCYVSVSNAFVKVFWYDVWPWLHNGFLVICFTVIIISNCIIISHIKASDKFYYSKLSEIKSSPLRHSATYQKRGYVRRRQMALLLLFASFTIVICTLPFSIFVTLDSNISFLNDSLKEQQIKHIISSVCFFLLYINRCCSFFLYCISGARFRKSLSVVCGCYESSSGAKSDNNPYVISRNSTGRIVSGEFTLTQKMTTDLNRIRLSSPPSETVIVSTRF